MDIEQEMIRYDRVRHINVYISKISFLSEHMHGSFELSYVLEGSAQYSQGTHRRKVTPGSLILTNPYEQHSFAALGEEPLVLLTLQIHKLFIRRYVETVPRLIFNTAQITDLTGAQYDAVVRLLLQTACSYIGNNPSRQFEVMGYTTLLLGKLFSILDWKLENNPDNSGKELQKNRVQRLVSYIDENYRQKITLSMLAEKEGISTTYLSHFFRKTFGVSFQEYLKAQRLEKALVLMHDKTISMVDICMNCGFSDSRYLEAACKKTFGCSVAEYRRRCEKQEEYELAPGDNVLNRKCSQKECVDILKNHVPSELQEGLE